MIKVHHQRAAGYIRGNVRWPRGTNYFADGVFQVLTKAQLEEVESDPAIKVERVNKAPEGATVIEELDLVERPAAGKSASGDEGNDGAAGDSGNENNAPAESSSGGAGGGDPERSAGAGGGDGDQGTGGDGDQGTGGDAPLSLGDFMRQMLAADPNQENDDWWTQAGKPEVAHLNGKGYDVDAKERNRVWDQVKP